MLNLQESGLSRRIPCKMKPRKIVQTTQDDLFGLKLDQMLNQRHSLYKLASQID